MIKIAFLGSKYSKDWIGGINYISNLLFAISQLENKKIEPIVFLGKKVDPYILKKLEVHAKIVQDSRFDRKSFIWYVSKILEKFFGTTILVDKILVKHGISVISHSEVNKGYHKFVKINWIPDFQHVYYPEFFSNSKNNSRNISYMNMIKACDILIVSSYSALNDAKEFSPGYSDKFKVLQFVSQPNPKIFTLNRDYLTVMESKYGFSGKFFYLPNQFWRHKNHLSFFEAIKTLKDEGLDILVLCSGYMQDNRSISYMDEIRTYIKENNLEDNIKLLGLIDYNDVLCLMRYSISVVNPSLFEGWSSTVEECKSVGKNMLLSDISVHVEQNPAMSVYFDSKNIKNMAEVLSDAWRVKKLEIPNLKFEREAHKVLNERTVEFAEKYQDIVIKSLRP